MRLILIAVATAAWVTWTLMCVASFQGYGEPVARVAALALALLATGLVSVVGRR